MDPAVCRERIEGLNAQAKELEEERDAVQHQAARAEIGAAGAMSIEEFSERFEQIMGRGAPASQRKHLVKVLVPRVTVYSREEIDVFFRVPVPPVRVTGSMARVAPCLDEPPPRARFRARVDVTPGPHSSRALGLRATRDAGWRATVGAVRPVVAELADRGSPGRASGGRGTRGERRRPSSPPRSRAAKGSTPVSLSPRLGQ